MDRMGEIPRRELSVFHPDHPVILSKPPRALRGFTFLEVLVALAILGSSFVVLLSAHSSALRQEARARRLMTATTLAREVIARSAIGDLPEFGSDSGEFEGVAGYAWARQVEATPFPGVLEVRVQVSWRAGEGEETTEFVYYAAEGLAEGSE